MWAVEQLIDLETFAREHVGYEAEMLVGTADLLRRMSEATIAHDAVLESFLVHARLLDDFLAHDVPKPGTLSEDDVVARHYLPNWPLAPVMSKSERDLANKMVAHLTTARADKRPVKIALVLAEVTTGLREFVVALPPDQRAWFARVTAAVAACDPRAAIPMTTTNLTDSAQVGGTSSD
jgi:hypothetical protein